MKKAIVILIIFITILVIILYKHSNERTLENAVVSQKIEEFIDEAKAKEITIEFLRKINKEIGNIIEVHLKDENLSPNKEWIIKTDNKLNITLNAKTGKIIKFIDENLFGIKVDTALDEQFATKTANEIYNNIKYNENYQFSTIYKRGIDNQWQVDFCIKYGEIFNSYQCIRIIFIGETKEISSIIVFDYEFENNPFDITEDKAIEISKKEFGEENIKEIYAKKDIKNLEDYIFLKEESNLENYESKKIRNVWNVEIIENKNNYKIIFYIDATTGEIIEKDSTK